MLRGTKREEVERGQVLAKPGSIKPHTKFKAEAYILKKKKAEDTLHSFQIIDHSFTLEQPMLLALLNFLKELKWLCQEITSQWK